MQIPRFARNDQKSAVCGKLLRFRRTAHYAEAYILRRCCAARTRVRRAVRASAFRFALSIGQRDPFGDVSSEVKHQFLVLLTLSCETARGSQEWRAAAKFFHLLPKPVRVVGVRRITCPVIQRVFAILLLIPAG